MDCKSFQFREWPHHTLSVAVRAVIRVAQHQLQHNPLPRPRVQHIAVPPTTLRIAPPHLVLEGIVEKDRTTLRPLFPSTAAAAVSGRLADPEPRAALAGVGVGRHCQPEVQLELGVGLAEVRADVGTLDPKTTRQQARVERA